MQPEASETSPIDILESTAITDEDWLALDPVEDMGSSTEDGSDY